MCDEYVIFDTETSGLNQYRNEVLSLAAVKAMTATGEIVDTFYSLVKPSERCVFEDKAMEVNGLDMEELRKASDKKSVYSSFLNFIGESCPLMAYNIPFDRRMLDADMERAGIVNAINPKRFIDILPMVRYKALPIPNNKLAVVCEHLGYKSDNFHNSLEDCKATNYVFRKLFFRQEG